MSLFRITIDEYIYEGTYTTQADAVFGAMRKLNYDRQAETYEAAAKRLRGEGVDEYYRHPDYRQARDEYSTWSRGPKLIAVEELTSRPGRGQRGKARRVGTVSGGDDPSV